MTGYTVHTGTSKKFIDGWDSIFGDAKPEKKTKKKGAKASAAKKPAPKKKAKKSKK